MKTFCSSGAIWVERVEHFWQFSSEMFWQEEWSAAESISGFSLHVDCKALEGEFALLDFLHLFLKLHTC